MLKSTTAFIAFLFAISIVYYLSFWGFFKIDVFQYLAVGDIIKGVAYPLRFGVVWVVLFSLFFAAVFVKMFIDKNPLKDIEKAKAQKKSVVSSLIVTSVSGFVYATFFSDSAIAGMIFSIFISFLSINIYALIETGVSYSKAEAEMANIKYSGIEAFSKVGNMFAFFIGVFLPVNALIFGQVEARIIASGKAYDYVMSRDFPAEAVKTNQPYLIFLGAVSEKYFFVDRSGIERYIIDKSQLPVIKSQHFDSSDRQSIAHFNANMGRVMATHRR